MASCCLPKQAKWSGAAISVLLLQAPQEGELFLLAIVSFFFLVVFFP